MLLAAAVLIAVARQAAQNDRSRRWARVAQRRAPVRRRAGSEYDGLLEHVDRQVEALLTERHRLQLLISQGERLRGMMQASAQMRPRIPSVERVLRHLRDKGGQLDQLIGRYYQQRDNLMILREADRFSRNVESFEEATAAAGSLGGIELETESLDEETERLLAIAEAEDELNAMLGG